MFFLRPFLVALCCLFFYVAWRILDLYSEIYSGYPANSWFLLRQTFSVGETSCSEGNSGRHTETKVDDIDRFIEMCLSGNFLKSDKSDEISLNLLKK